MQLIFSCDAREARPIIAQLSYLSVTRTAFQIEEELQNRSRMLVKQEWQAIRVIADALLEREWEPVQPLPSGGVWSQEQMAKHLNGKEVVGLLSDSESVDKSRINAELDGSGKQEMQSCKAPVLDGSLPHRYWLLGLGRLLVPYLVRSQFATS